MRVQAVRLALRIAEFAEAVGVSRSKAYEMAARREIPTIRLGGSLRVPVDALEAWMARKLAEREAQ